MAEDRRRADLRNLTGGQPEGHLDMVALAKDACDEGDVRRLIVVIERRDGTLRMLVDAGRTVEHVGLLGSAMIELRNHENDDFDIPERDPGA